MNETPVKPRSRAPFALSAMALLALGFAVVLLWLVVVDGLRDKGAALGIASAIGALPVLFAAALSFVAARLVRSGALRARAVVFTGAMALAVLSISYLTAVVVDTRIARLSRTTHELVAAVTGDLPFVSRVLDKVAREGGAPPRPRDDDDTGDAGARDAGAPDGGVAKDTAPPDAGPTVIATSPARDAGVPASTSDAGPPRLHDAGGATERAPARAIGYAAVSLVLDTGASAVARIALLDDDTARVTVVSLAALAARGPLTREAAYDDGELLVVVGKERVARVPLTGELDVVRDLARGARLPDGAVVDAVRDALPLSGRTLVAIVDAGAPLVTRLVLLAPNSAPRVLHEVKKSERTLTLKAAHGDTFVVEDRPLRADPRAPAELLLGHASGSGALQSRAKEGDAIAPLGKSIGTFGSVMIRRDAALVVDTTFADAPKDGWPVLIEDGAVPRAWLATRFPDGAPFSARDERLYAPVVEPSGGFLATTGGAVLTGDLFAPNDIRLVRDPVVEAEAGPQKLARVLALALAPTRRSALVVADMGTPTVRGVYVIATETGAAEAILREGAAAWPGARIRSLEVAPVPTAR